jgi:hypothetical protein
MISEGQRRLGPAQSIRFATDGSPGKVAPLGPESRSVWSAVPRRDRFGVDQTAASQSGHALRLSHAPHTAPARAGALQNLAEGRAP